MVGGSEVSLKLRVYTVKFEVNHEKKGQGGGILKFSLKTYTVGLFSWVEEEAFFLIRGKCTSMKNNENNAKFHRGRGHLYIFKGNGPVKGLSLLKRRRPT
ncbi:hypothetical protein ACF0H5_023396 [Mactra antiquata]